jgi:hypothetical protein
VITTCGPTLRLHRLWVSSAHGAQLVEHVLGKDEVSGSIPLVGSSSGSVDF